jgi:spore coat polysaccharide biosynthesis protein SpsF
MDRYETAWAGNHGKDYAERCKVEAKDRIDIFNKLLNKIQIKNYPSSSILEIGCNKGHNLEAIKTALDKIQIINNYIIQGIDINRRLCTKPNIINGSIYELPWVDNTFEVTLTSGVLIHIPPPRLKEALFQMRSVSNRYTIMIEYNAEKEVGTKYGIDFNYMDGVWARPYGKIYKKKFPKDKLISTGKISDLGSDGWGFSKCDYWIFEKQQEK